MASALAHALVQPPYCIKSFFSVEHIESGKPWFNEVTEKLEIARDVVICVTPENWQSHWTHFEAGYAARSTGKIYAYCLPSAVKLLDGPISQYELNVADRKGSETLFAALSGKSDTEEFDGIWENHLAPALRNLDAPHMKLILPELTSWFRRKTFDEPIRECSDQQWLDRYFGARETHARLKRQRDTVRDCCAEHQLWLYDQLTSHVDAYVRIIERYLVRERSFDITDNGTVDFSRPVPGVAEGPKGDIHTIVERRCTSIRRTLFCLTDTAARPVLFPQAVQFARFWLKEFDQRKKMVRTMDVPQDKDELIKCRDSYWDYDRIAYYLHCDNHPTSFTEHSDAFEKELEYVESYNDPVSRMPLYYSIRTLARKMAGQDQQPKPEEAQRILKLCESVKTFLFEQGHRQEKKITGVIGQIVDRLESAGQARL
jgi:hypothetical protein